jgi:hypothetical protein
MKTFCAIFLTLALGTWWAGPSAAQTPKRAKIGVLHVDVSGLVIPPEEAGNLLRLELERLDTLEVIDRYDAFYLLRKADFAVANCYGKQCLTEAGRIIKANWMLMGTVERYSGKILVSLRLIDVDQETMVKTVVREFLEIPERVQPMLQLALNDLFGRPSDAFLAQQLTKPQTQESLLTNPYVRRLRSDGPRMGFTVFAGELAARLREGQGTGGFDVVPVFFQFGYQFEKQYLNEGKFQALFEFIPLVTGIDQGLLIPSFTVLNGLRNNKNGWEFAFGPTVRFVAQAEGYYDPNGTWRLRSNTTPTDVEYLKRLDSRGTLEWSTGFVVAFGKTFRSGKLNIPLNGYVVPHKDGLQAGLSFGFNAKN